MTVFGDSLDRAGDQNAALDRKLEEQGPDDIPEDLQIVYPVDQ